MTARTTRRTFTLGAVATTAGALALALIPATVANAVTATPVFSYIDVSGGTVADPIRQLAVDDVFGTSISSTQAKADLTAANIQTYTYDVAPDGQTIAIAARTGSPTADAFDSTFGMVVVHDDGVNPRTSKLVANFWDANPVLTNGGAKVWWIDSGTLYSADTATGTPTAHTTALAPKNDGASAASGGPNDTESVSRLAVSEDGTMAAVMYRGLGSNTTDRVLAVPVDTGKSADGYAEISYAAKVSPIPTIRPNNSTFVWRGNDQLIYGEYDEADNATVLGVSVAVPAGSHPSVVVKQANLDGFYDLRLAADGLWWLWKDTGALSTAYSVSDANLFTVAPIAQSSDRGNGDSTFRYVPSTVAPPSLDSTPGTGVGGNITDNRAVIHPTFAFTATTVKYAARVAYQTIGLYGGLPGGGYDAARAAETDRGELWRSIDNGTNWSKVTTTSGANVFQIGTKWYNAYTPVLARNTLFRWSSAGDAFTLPFTTSARKITVVPTVTVKIVKSGTYRTVYGTATRKAGTASLQRYYSGLGWRVVVARTMTSTGAFNFGKRVLAKGSYRVVTNADVSWGAGVKAFTV